MKIDNQYIDGKKMKWLLRCPMAEDALELSKLRILLDGETENLDREPGEGILSESDFQELIKVDLEARGNLFLVAEVEGNIVGFARCIRKELKRFNHQAEFGICIKQEYCGYGIGKQLIKNIVEWSEENGIEKICLHVIESNKGAINLYKRYGFVQEGILVKDRKHSDGSYHNTIIMGRIASN